MRCSIDEMSGLSGVHFHDLHHPGDQLVANEGANFQELMVRMGHESSCAALIYLQSSAGRQRALADAVGDTTRANCPSLCAKRLIDWAREGHETAVRLPGMVNNLRPTATRTRDLPLRRRAPCTGGRTRTRPARRSRRPGTSGPACRAWRPGRRRTGSARGHGARRRG